MPNIRNLIILTLLSLFMLALGVLGYMVLEDWGFLDALVMTIISVISVGFSEVRHLSPEGRLFTLILIFIGVGLVPYVTGSVVPFMVEGQIRRRHFNIIIIAIRKLDDTMIFNSSPKEVIRANATIIVVGEDNRLSRFNQTVMTG